MTGWRKSSASYSEGNCAEVAAWRKSSASMGNECAEVGQGGAGVLVRDTMDRSGPWLAFSQDAWRRFTAALKAA